MVSLSPPPVFYVNWVFQQSFEQGFKGMQLPWLMLLFLGFVHRVFSGWFSPPLWKQIKYFISPCFYHRHPPPPPAAGALEAAKD